jgi:hypothetical protein
MRKAVAIQAAGYVALLALIYEWLGIADRSVWQLFLSVILGLVIVFGAVWLIASALEGTPMPPLRQIGSLLGWIGIAAAIVLCCVWLAGYRPNVGLSVGSRLTLWFRRPVAPQTIGTIYFWLVWIAGTAGVLTVLPLAVKARPGRRYWITSGLLAIIGIALPALLIRWVPKFESFGVQTASMILRFGLAYAVALSAWLLIAKAARAAQLDDYSPTQQQGGSQRHKSPAKIA